MGRVIGFHRWASIKSLFPAVDTGPAGPEAIRYRTGYTWGHPGMSSVHLLTGGAFDEMQSSAVYTVYNDLLA